MLRNLHSSVEPIKKSIPAACAKASDILHFIFPLELSETINSFHRHMNFSVCMLNVSGIADPSQLFWYCGPVVCQPFWFRGPLHLSTFLVPRAPRLSIFLVPQTPSPQLFRYRGPLVSQPFWYPGPPPQNCHLR